MNHLLVLALALYGAQAMPQPAKRQLDDPGCLSTVPANPDPNTVNQIYLAAVAQNVNMLVMQATFETCLQESHCNNLNCGDQDSLGAFQQRSSMGWGTPQQITNVTYATNSFLAQAIPLAASEPGASPDAIAQGVQRAQAGNLYASHLDQANQLIQQAAAATGVSWNGIHGGGGSNPPTSSGGGGGGGGGSCQTYTAVSGDSCWAIATNRGLSVGTFMSWNPSINSGCTNLQVGTAYCVSASGGGSSFPPVSGGGGGGGGCQRYTAVSGDSCWAIATNRGLNVGTFMSWNPSINSGCTNLQAGTAYCISSP